MSLFRHPHTIHPQYRPDIDGLRAVAILSVLLFHAFPSFFSAGFIGVDIFFVISGFLISTIIFSSLEKSRFSYLDFYSRRIRRIFPALTLVLLFSIAIGWFILLPDEFAALGKHITGGVAFISNFILWRESGYFDTQSQRKILLHLWSLAIEEQFYIFWPLLLALLWKKRVGFLKITIVIAALSFIANIYLARTHPVADFFLPLPRVWELMIGGALAYVMSHERINTSHHSNFQSIVGFALIFIALAFIGRESLFPGYWALAPTVGTAFVISAGPSAYLNRALLSNRIMVWIGLISYPLYLWHWPLLAFIYIADNGAPALWSRLAALLLAILLASATYVFVEKPIRSGLLKQHAVLPLVTIMLAIIVAGASMNKGRIEPRIHNLPIMTVIHARHDWEETDPAFDSFRYGGEKFQRAMFGKKYSTVFVGDSHILQYLPRVSYLIGKSPEKKENVYFASDEGCFPVPGVFGSEGIPSVPYCQEYIADVTRFIEDKTITTVVLGACWNCYFLPHRDKKAELLSDANEREYGLEMFRSFLSQLVSSGKQVYVVLDNPIGSQFDPSSYLHGNRWSSFTTTKIPERASVAPDEVELRDKLERIAESAGARIIDPSAFLCNSKDRCLVAVNNGWPIYTDGNHLRAHFVVQNAKYIDASLVQVFQ